MTIEKDNSENKKKKSYENELIFFNESYQFRHNRYKLFAELLFELFSYEKKADRPPIRLKDKKYIAYIKNIINLLFYYVFNLNKYNKKYTIKCHHKDIGIFSETENSSEDESEEESESDKGEGESEENSETEKGEDEEEKKQIEQFFTDEKHINETTLKEVGEHDIISLKIFLPQMEKAEGNLQEKQNEELNRMCDILFCPQHTKCGKNVETLKEKKKVEINILNIYYTAFYIRLIELFATNSQVEICDIICFFLFNDVENVNSISTIFSDGFYTLERIYLYVDQIISNKNSKKENLETLESSELKTEEQVNIEIDLKNLLKEKMESGLNQIKNEKRIRTQIEGLVISNGFLINEDYKLKLTESSKLLRKFSNTLYLTLKKKKHFQFCQKIFFFKELKLNYLEASKPWIFYWVIHTFYILYNSYEIEQMLGKGTFNCVKQCIFFYLLTMKDKKNGCFGGGLNQYTHVATTYAAVCVFIYLHDNENNFLDFIDRKKLHSYILKLKCPDGSFRLHKNGEIDLRGTYCAIAICSMCHILTKKIKKNVEKYIISCQNYEGGFSSEKMQECHGGYTYCALATLCIIGKVNKVNMNSLTNWLINKQSNLEGSLIGRTNKVVDACYSFWVGACYFLINEIKKLKYFINIFKHKKELSSSDFQLSRTQCNQMDEKMLCNLYHLRLYLLCCSQHANGGMRDKPTAKVDYYHTCYALSGFTLIENYLKEYDDDYLTPETTNFSESPYKPNDNSLIKLNNIHILYNLNIEEAYKGYNFFSPQFPLHGNKVNCTIGKGAYIYLKSLYVGTLTF